MAFQNSLRRVQAIVRDNLRNKREHRFFERRDLSAIYGKLSACAVSVDSVLILVKELAHTVLYYFLRGAVSIFHRRAFQEVVNTVNQRIVIHHIADIGVLNHKVTTYDRFLSLFKIWRARKAQYIAEILALGSPFSHHLTQFYLSVRGMVYLVDENGKMRHLTYDIAQFVGCLYLAPFLFRE